ncbi:uncharacterized protein LOC128863026 [Anastrepha ludens]|uniref:uncharacterized protein LOC128855497 n=1 Tax=Anastrepha ludens TaxID=28586 RepID=UPI0023B120C4|nr:uncharacterized protein LOC128855497 [Anastrepha ludens]XP_053957894.1 uncharacterized protein LOC128863026 [Anastrepha ludens]
MASRANKEIWKEFFEVYRSYPEIWKIKSEEYKNKIKKNAAYETLLEKYKEIDPKATVESLKYKINSIRSCYRRELKKLKQSEKSGAGVDDVYVSSLWYFDDLSFLEEQETQRTGLSSIENEEHEDTTFEDNAPAAKKAKTEFGKKEKEELLKKAVKALEDSTRPNDDASTFSSTWEVLFRKLDPTQQLFANKTIMEVLYQGALGQLNENSHQLFNVPNTRCSSRPLSSSDNSSTCFDKRTMQNRASTPFFYSDNSSTCFVASTVQNRPEYIISPPLPSPTQLISTPASQVQYTRFHSTVQPQQYQQISSINIQPQETINTQQYGNNTEYRTFSDLLNDSEYS